MPNPTPTAFIRVSTGRNRELCTLFYYLDTSDIIKQQLDQLSRLNHVSCKPNCLLMAGVAKRTNAYGMDITETQRPKLLSDIPHVDIVITMGCNVECPHLPCNNNESLLCHRT